MSTPQLGKLLPVNPVGHAAAGDEIAQVICLMHTQERAGWLLRRLAADMWQLADRGNPALCCMSLTLSQQPAACVHCVMEQGIRQA